MIKLYSYWRSSAAYRVRIALNLKNVAFEIIPVNVIEEQQHTVNYKSVNPQALIPTLIDDEVKLGQSIAIIEYLEERYPEPSLLPKVPARKAFARQLAQLIASDIHPLNNLRVLTYLRRDLGVDDHEKKSWYRHWVNTGLDSLNTLLKSETGTYCVGDKVSIADVCLIPQLYNAHRFDISLERYPRLMEIETECLKLPAFNAARPEHQPDARMGANQAPD